MNIMDMLFGSDSKQSSSYDKNQQNWINNLGNTMQNQMGAANIQGQPGYQQGLEHLMSMFNDPKFFEQMEAPMMRQFQEETVPGIANRFAGAGSAGSMNSTGFRNAMLREGQNLSSNMAQQRGQMKMNAIPQLLQYSQQPFQNLMNMYGITTGKGMNDIYQPASPGLLQNFASGAGQAAGKYMFGGM